MKLRRLGLKGFFRETEIWGVSRVPKYDMIMWTTNDQATTDHTSEKQPPNTLKAICQEIQSE